MSRLASICTQHPEYTSCHEPMPTPLALILAVFTTAAIVGLAVSVVAFMVEEHHYSKECKEMERRYRSGSWDQ